MPKPDIAPKEMSGSYSQKSLAISSKDDSTTLKDVYSFLIKFIFPHDGAIKFQFLDLDDQVIDINTLGQRDQNITVLKLMLSDDTSKLPDNCTVDSVTEEINALNDKFKNYIKCYFSDSDFASREVKAYGDPNAESEGKEIAEALLNFAEKINPNLYKSSHYEAKLTEKKKESGLNSVFIFTINIFSIIFDMLNDALFFTRNFQAQKESPLINGNSSTLFKAKGHCGSNENSKEPPRVDPDRNSIAP